MLRYFSGQGPIVGPGIKIGPVGVTTALMLGAGIGAGSDGDLNTTMNKKTTTTNPKAARNATKSAVTLAVRCWTRTMAWVRAR